MWRAYQISDETNYSGKDTTTQEDRHQEPGSKRTNTGSVWNISRPAIIDQF